MLFLLSFSWLPPWLNPTWTGGAPSRPSVTFPKIYFRKFCQKVFLVISVYYYWRHHFLTKVILVKLKILYILTQWSKWFIFWNIFLYCKIISFLELFSLNRFLRILQTQLVFWFFFYFESILYVCKSWCITTLYYQYSHFLVHDDNKNTLCFFQTLKKRC